MTNENNAEHPATWPLPTLATLGPYLAPANSIGVAAMPSLYLSENDYNRILGPYAQWFKPPTPSYIDPSVARQVLRDTTAYISPQNKAVQKLTAAVKQLQERKEITELEKRIEELEVQLMRCEAEKEELRREKYELELLQPRCQDCHVAFNRKKEDGSLEIKASQGATKCSPQIGNRWCSNLAKARYMAGRRAQNKPQD